MKIIRIFPFFKKKYFKHVHSFVVSTFYNENLPKRDSTDND